MHLIGASLSSAILSINLFKLSMSLLTVCIRLIKASVRHKHCLSHCCFPFMCSMVCVLLSSQHASVLLVMTRLRHICFMAAISKNPVRNVYWCALSQSNKQMQLKQYKIQLDVTPADTPPQGKLIICYRGTNGWKKPICILMKSKLFHSIGPGHIKVCCGQRK